MEGLGLPLRLSCSHRISAVNRYKRYQQGLKLRQTNLQRCQKPAPIKLVWQKINSTPEGAQPVSKDASSPLPTSTNAALPSADSSASLPPIAAAAPLAASTTPAAVDSTTAATSTTPNLDAGSTEGASTSQGSASNSNGTGAGPATNTPLGGLQQLIAGFAASLVALWAWFRSFPGWVQAQHIKRLRELSDDEPGDVDKHAAYLAELNKVNPKEVVLRVESKQFATNASVTVEYLKALVATGKIHEYSGDEAPRASDDHRSLPQLLRDLQAACAGTKPDETPGASVQRPLHVQLHGVGALAGAQPGPFRWLWSLAWFALSIVAFSFAWLVGSHVVRRLSGQSAVISSTPAPSSPANGAASSGGSGGSPSIDPKEYKKEEMSEKSIKSFKDVKGCDEAKEELKEIVEFLRNPTRFTRLGAKLPKGVLLTGPPGTGKTLLARAVAGEAGVPFFYRAGSEFEELYVGVGARRMRALFAAAKKKAPCIVFIDEIDAIGGSRKHWENHTRKTLNQLLVEMDGFEANEGVIVMAATNLPETLDAALKRPGRFDRQVAVPVPDVKGRLDILEYYVSDKPMSLDVDIDLIARQTAGFSGADLSNLVNEAALLAAKQGSEDINAAMIDYAFDKIRMGVERKSVRRTPEALKRTAVHESGHALAALFTPGAKAIHKATIVPRGHALGMVTQVGSQDEFSINREQMMAEIHVLMGGKVAEELAFGPSQVTSGCTNDLKQATNWARHMVTECGLCDEIGPIYIENEKSISEGLKQQVDHEVRKILVGAQSTVKTLLTERMDDLHKLSDALLEHETLTAADIDAVLKGQFTRPPPTRSNNSSTQQPAAGDGEPALLAAENAAAVATTPTRTNSKNNSS